jgi:hypothetical protein
MEACANPTPPDARSSAFVNPCQIGVPARGPDNSIISCTADDETVCPGGFYCQVNEKAGTCCERSSKEDRCNLPMSTGEGPNQLRRFYYNPIAQKCIEFLYHGVRGNENNFLTYESCKARCMSKNIFVDLNKRVFRVLKSMQRRPSKQ